MTRRRKILITILAALIASVVGYPVAWIAAEKWYERSAMRQAVPIQQQLESYRQAHGEYPETLSSIKGIMETGPGPLHYYRPSPSNYQLWFEFGKNPPVSHVYDSAAREWLLAEH